MKALPVNLLASSGNSGKVTGFVLIALAAVAILAARPKQDNKPGY